MEAAVDLCIHIHGLRIVCSLGSASNISEWMLFAITNSSTMIRFHACRQSFQEYGPSLQHPTSPNWSPLCRLFSAKDPMTTTAEWKDIFNKDFEGQMNGILSIPSSTTPQIIHTISYIPPYIQKAYSSFAMLSGCCSSAVNWEIDSTQHTFNPSDLSSWLPSTLSSVLPSLCLVWADSQQRSSCVLCGQWMAWFSLLDGQPE